MMKKVGQKSEEKLNGTFKEKDPSAGSEEKRARSTTKRAKREILVFGQQKRLGGNQN